MLRSLHEGTSQQQSSLSCCPIGHQLKKIFFCFCASLKKKKWCKHNKFTVTLVLHIYTHEIKKQWNITIIVLLCKRHFAEIQISEQCKRKRSHCYLPVCEIKGSRKQLKQDKEKKNFSVSQTGAALLFCFHLFFSFFADKWALAIQFLLKSLLFQLCFLYVVSFAHICVVCLCVRQISAIYLPLPEILLQTPQSKKINRSSKHFNLILLHLPGAFRPVSSFAGELCSLVYTVISFKHCRRRWKLHIMHFQ